MFRIAVCIPTYKRPEMLQALILSILNGSINRSLISNIDIIVVDNDGEQSARGIISKLQEEKGLEGLLHYYSFTQKGLSYIRNELFEKALLFKPDFIAGIDDDEYTTSEWLNELVKTITKNNADIVVGPVIRKCGPEISPFIAALFRHHTLPDNKAIQFFETGNYIISTNFLLVNNMKFDLEFNTTGAEDSYFGVTALKKGAKIHWSAGAVAYETIPPKRATIQWLLKNTYRGAITYTYILKREGKTSRLLKKFFVNIAYLLAGILTAIFILFPFKGRYWGILKVAEGGGGFAGLFNIKYHEYKKAR